MGQEPEVVMGEADLSNPWIWARLLGAPQERTSCLSATSFSPRDAGSGVALDQGMEVFRELVDFSTFLLNKLLFFKLILR